MGYCKGQSKMEGCVVCMKDLCEELYFYYVALKTKFISFDLYKSWLNKTFINSDILEDFLLELQFSSNSLERTIEMLYIYLYEKLDLIDYNVVMRMIIQELKEQYKNDSKLYEITKKLYNIWCLLPREVSFEKPFIILNSIDDPWSWGEKKDVVESINKLINYYK